MIIIPLTIGTLSCDIINDPINTKSKQQIAIRKASNDNDNDDNDDNDDNGDHYEYLNDYKLY